TLRKAHEMRARDAPRIGIPPNRVQFGPFSGKTWLVQVRGRGLTRVRVRPNFGISLKRRRISRQAAKETPP
ncbi:MAG TPA: hypothetical protein VNC50_13430, partial [Planctomycetia bacterium]|nr:hypothetical protein [Planctomycetia bacterium]